MMRILIPYGTTEGLTARISEYVADVIRGHGHEAEAMDLKGPVDPEPDDYDAVIVGASIHMGKHEDYVLNYVKRHREALERLPSAFFSVSMAAHDNPEEAEGYIEEFVRETGWRPARVGLFGGALLYTHYGFIKRHMMKRIVRDKGNPDTDTSRDYIYTEWDGVKHFVEEFLKLLPSRYSG
ncbi:MAG: protoporphyrinogen oxidase [Actinomycetota bacterium]|nr:protoporphyrinogen oxidase [Actinomycetota bacterium]